MQSSLRNTSPQLRAALRASCRGQRAFTGSSTSQAKEVRIVEVGPRDGLQNEKKSIPVATKIELVRRLAKTGLTTIEAGSFVSPKWTPQMASSSDILSNILSKTPESRSPITYQWLLPNMKGLDNYLSTHAAQPKPASGTSTRSIHSDLGPALNTSSADANAMPSSTSGVDAMEKNERATLASSNTDTGPALNTSSADANAMPSSTSGVDAMEKNEGHSKHKAKHEISIFMAATETFSKKNTNCSIQESLDRFQPLIAKARKEGFGVRAYISVALGCPYEGPNVDPHKVAEIAAALLEMGADEVSVADTTGMGTVPRTRELLKVLSSAGIRNEDLALHFHDTYGQALPNILVSLEHGVTVFDSAVSGLGGCPYSPGATGNVATEDLVHMLHSLGVRTGVDMMKLAEIGEWISGEVGKSNESRAGKATLARMRQ